MRLMPECCPEAVHAWPESARPGGRQAGMSRPESLVVSKKELEVLKLKLGKVGARASATMGARILSGLIGLTLLMGGVHQAHAASIAVFGDNAIDNYINTLPGYSATLVTDAQLSTPGFLNSFDAFFMTRDGFSFGTGLSGTAAANVASYVGASGNVVLFNGDFADSIFSGDANIEMLVKNAVGCASGSGHGYLGEFNGAVSALTANSNGFNPIGLIPGSAGPLGFANGGSTGSLVITPFGVGHPVMTGVALPYNPPDVEFGASLSGINPTLVLATYDGNPENPAIIARGSVVPEPCSLALLGIGTPALLAFRRRRKSEA